MIQCRVKKIIAATVCALLPGSLFAQDSGLAGEIGGLQQTLNTVYNAMIVNCSELIGVGRGIAGFGALCYISYRVWGHIARAEPIDFYPLLRPFRLFGPETQDC